VCAGSLWARIETAVSLGAGLGALWETILTDAGARAVVTEAAAARSGSTQRNATTVLPGYRVPVTVTVIAHAGPGDRGELVVTIMDPSDL
jgi:hypothetical protein